MLSLDISFDQVRTVVLGERARLLWNVDAVGNASGDPTTALKDIELFPGATGDPRHGITPHGAGPHGGFRRASNEDLPTPAVHFGRVKVAASAVDARGNAQSGAANVAEVVVNSPPRPARRFERGSFSGGRQMFSFTESRQLKG